MLHSSGNYIGFWYNESKAPTTPAPEKQFPAGTVIGGIITVIIIGAFIFGVIIPFFSNSGNNSIAAKTVEVGFSKNSDGSVNVIADARYITKVQIPYRKWQTITFTANGKVASSTVRINPASYQVGPKGWSYKPGPTTYRKTFDIRQRAIYGATRKTGKR